MIPLSKTITPAIPLMPSNQKNKALHLIEIQYPVIWAWSWPGITSQMIAPWRGVNCDVCLCCCFWWWLRPGVLVDGDADIGHQAI